MEYKTITTREEFQSYYLEFSALYEECFHQPMDMQEIEWRYFQNPIKDLFVCFAIDNGHLVANYSVSPVFLYYKGSIIKAVQSLNTMTHPDYAGQGLFVKLATKIYSSAQDHGYEMVWGFPNHLSNPTFIKRLNWHDVLIIPTLELNLESVSCISETKDVVEDSKFLIDYMPCLENYEKIQVYKSNDYLKWRFAEHPHIKYTVFCLKNKNLATSRIICKEYKDKLNIVDYSFSSAAEMKALLNAAISYAKNLNKISITLWSQLEDDMHLLLERYGARNVLPITYFGNSIFNNTCSSEIFCDGRKWMLHMSDDNVY